MQAQTFNNVFDAICDTRAESINLTLRAQLMDDIRATIQRNNWTQTAAAEKCGITQPRMNDLINGKINKFSLDALINIATQLGRRISLDIQAA